MPVMLVLLTCEWSSGLKSLRMQKTVTSRFEEDSAGFGGGSRAATTVIFFARPHAHLRTNGPHPNGPGFCTSLRKVINK